MKYRVCPDCGAHLDPGERCDCKSDCETKEKSRPAGTETAPDDEDMTGINLIYHPSSPEVKSQALLPPAYRPREAAEAQARFCERSGYLLFAPRSGYCYKCGRNIYKPFKTRAGDTLPGYTVEQAGHVLITYCPFCHVSYID